MTMFDFIIILTCVSYIWSLETPLSKSRIFQKCKIENFQKKFDVLPGRGWDNLNNRQMGQILNLNFSSCQYSQDNIYLIPDSMSLTPIKNSKVELSADLFSHFSQYKTLTSQSINVEAHGGIFGFSISGSFSKESEQVKSDQISTKSSIFRVQLRYNVFKSMSEPDAELHPNFRNRIFDIAGLIIENKDSLYPAYLADLIIRDFGTHVINSVNAGAVLSKIDMLKSNYERKYASNMNAISVSASVSFGSYFGLSTKYSKRVENSQLVEYDQSCSKTRIETYGGALYGANFSLDKWRSSVLDNMVPIDRHGIPIFDVITPRALPELDDMTVHKVYNLIKEATKRYYSANARRGCMDINSPNFNSDANINSKSCESAKVVFNFGGVFQSCSGPEDQCQYARQINPSTGSYSCPQKYQSVILHSGLYECRNYCYSYWIFWIKCNTHCSYYTSYWCYPMNVNDTTSGYQFGGFVSDTMKTCPLNYVSLKIGLRSQICVSLTNNPFNTDAIKFGGLYSCSAGNPLARDYVNGSKNPSSSSQMRSLQFWPKTCAKGYVAHLMSIDNGCEIAYCAETNKVSLGSLPELIRPPFISLNYNPNSTKVSTLKGADRKTYIKTKDGNWTDKKREINLIVGSVFGTFFGVVLIAALIVIVQRNKYRKHISRLEENDFLVDTMADNYGTIDRGNGII